MTPLPVIVTDLDATLLDHETYSWQPAAAAIETIRGHGWPLVLNSSKTRAEIAALREELRNDDPFVVENGAAVYSPPGYFAKTGDAREAGLEVHRLGVDRAEIVKHVRRLRGERHLDLQGFADWTPAEIAARTGLSEEAAERAAERCCSEPLVFDGDQAQLHWFQSELDRVGLDTAQGGRFLHVMGRCDKGAAVRWLRERYSEKFSDQDVRIIALGDSPNDEEMLNAADVAVVIRSARSDQLSVSQPSRVYRTSARGPAGWQEAMNELLPEFA